MIDGKAVVRYYSPLSRPDDLGHIDLLIKVDDYGLMSHFLAGLKYGGELAFKGPMGGFEFEDNGITKIGLICGGTGISPMIQIMRDVLFHKRNVQIKMLYGALNENEIVTRELLDRNAASFPNFQIYYILEKVSLISTEPLFVTQRDWQPPEGWTQGVGFISKEIIKEQMFPPSPDLKVVLCGPPGMCKALKPIINELGYTGDMFFSYM